MDIPRKGSAVITQNDLARLDGTDVYGTDGDKIGSVGQVYVDAQSGDPAWVTVKTGLFGTKETFVPLQDADVIDDRITVAYAKNQVKDAPRIDADGPLSHADEDHLYTYYGMPTSSDRTDAGRADNGYQDNGDQEPGAPDASRSQAGSTGDQNAMTRSEQRLVADTRTEQAGKARLRKYVVTENQQVDVPVSREEVRLEREPVTEADRGAAVDGPDISEAEHEVTLHAERPVVDTETVPVERVRLGKETVRDQETVSGDVRKEQIEFDGPDRNDRR
jgi:uncharacterized protein (TIGR02271 family)